MGRHGTVHVAEKQHDHLDNGPHAASLAVLLSEFDLLGCAVRFALVGRAASSAPGQRAVSEFHGEDTRVDDVCA